ncbi:MAG: hypothetical protein KBC83_04770 [Candidatus Moranbacteria bacterium]|jgi:hypothetical protein|nr:hypothetical protein [Candidatus Moranbacteria bacterium]MBP9801943.1 hypothetical protein [Candidatus Moranbacteria bacterium]
MPEEWPKEWLKSWPEEIKAIKTATISCIFIVVDRYTQSSIHELKAAFQNNQEVTIHTGVLYPGEIAPDSHRNTTKHEHLRVLQIDFFFATREIVYKTEKIHPDGTSQPAGLYLEIRNRRGCVLWRFPQKCIHQSYTEWI